MQQKLFEETPVDEYKSVTQSTNYFGEIVPVYKRTKRLANLVKFAKMNTPNAIVKYFREIWAADIGLRERVYVAFFNSNNQVIGHCELGSGGVTSAVVDVRLLFQRALLCPGTVSFAIAHCHPSGNLNPSGADNHLTAMLATAGKTMEFVLLDHFILTLDSFFCYSQDASHSKYLVPKKLTTKIPEGS